MEDREIVELYWQRSDLAISETEQKYGRYCRSIAYNICGRHEDAEECVNDTWLGVWNSIPPARPSPLGTFVCRIARNLAIKRYHAERAQTRNSRYDLALDELAECLPDHGSVEDSIEAKELAGMISAFLDTLPYVDKFLFMRRYWYADSLPEIAEMAGMRCGTAAVRLHRVREKLRNYLKKEGVPV